jgi:hypothetical protein
VHGKREIVADNGNLISLAGFRHQRSGAAAVRTLQILKDHERDRGSFGRPERGIYGLGWGQ